MLLCLCLLTFLAETFLAWQQTIRYNGGYPSDVSLYIDIATKRPTPLRAINFLFSHLLDLFGNTLGIALLLGLAVALTVVANYLFLSYLLNRNGVCPNGGEGSTSSDKAQSTGLLLLVRRFLGLEHTYIGADRPRLLALSALMALFSGPVYIPGLMPYFYTHTLSKYAWQSPTQIVMMLFGILSLWLFLRMRDSYLEKIKPLQWILLTLGFLASAWAKPSFIMIFFPLMAVVLVWDFLFGSTRCPSLGKRFRNIFIVGSSVFPSMIYFLVLNSSVFGEATYGTSTGAKHVTIMLGRAYFNQDFNVPLSLLAGLLFPLLVLLFNLPALKNLRYSSGWLLLFIGIAEHFTFSESGWRTTHGNFAWGKKAGAYFLFLISLGKFLENLWNPEFLKNRPGLRKFYFGLGMILLALHVLCQLYYFYLLARGYNYLI